MDTLKLDSEATDETESRKLFAHPALGAAYSSEAVQGIHAGRISQSCEVYVRRTKKTGGQAEETIIRRRIVVKTYEDGENLNHEEQEEKIIRVRPRIGNKLAR